MGIFGISAGREQNVLDKEQDSYVYLVMHGNQQGQVTIP